MPSNHRITIIGDSLVCMARCSCTARSPMARRDDVTEWIHHHRQDVERAKAKAGGRNPTLATQRDWFAAQADDPHTPPEDRQLWRQLADEVDAFVKTKATPSIDQLALF